MESWRLGLGSWQVGTVGGREECWRGALRPWQTKSREWKQGGSIEGIFRQDEIGEGTDEDVGEERLAGTEMRSAREGIPGHGQVTWLIE